MNDAQTWTAISALLAAVFSFAAVVVRTLEARVDGLDHDVTALMRRGIGDE